MTISQDIENNKSDRIRLLIKELGLSQKDFAEKLSMDQGAIAKHLNGTRPVGKNVEYKILKEYNVNRHWWDTGEGDIFNKQDVRSVTNGRLAETEDTVELTYISTHARASFTELHQILNEPNATYKVFKNASEGNISDQIVIEIDGDSMEPNYWTGAKVRAKEVPMGDWQYLNSGVYAVVYTNFFVIKRVKNSPQNGIVILHSDNTETGGCIEVPLSDVRKIWRVIRIVDAPAR